MSAADRLLAYPVQRDDWYVGLAIGGLCIAFGALLVPLIVVYGYLIRVGRSVMSGHETPPSFADPIELLTDGIQGWIIGLVYLLVPILVGILTLGGAAHAVVTGGEIGQIIGFGALFLGGLGTVIVTIAFAYLAVAALLSFASTGTFASAFALEQLRPVLGSTEFAIAYAGVLVLVSAAIAAAALPIIGWILGPFLLWYVLVVGMAVLARAFASSQVV